MRLLVTGVVTATLGAGLVPPAQAGAVAPTIKVTSRTWTEHYNDVGRPGESPGDTIAFTDKLFQNGDRVGRDTVNCVVKRATRRSFTMQCFATLVFKGRGDITVQGAITYSRNSTENPLLAVTGGTREFEGADGHMELVEGNGPTRYKIYLTA
jgi:hypothetical protein